MTEERFDPIQHYYKLFRRRFGMFVVLCIAAMLFGTAILKLIPVVYKSEAIVVTELNDLSPETPSGEPIKAEDEFLTVEQNAIGEAELLGLVEEFNLFPEKARHLSRTDLLELVGDRLDIRRVTEGPFVVNDNERKYAASVAFYYADAAVAKAVVDRVTEMLLAADVAVRVQRMKDKVDLIEGQYRQITTALAEIDAEKAKFAGENIDSLPERLSTNLEEIERRNVQLQEIDLEINTLENEKKLLDAEFQVRAAALRNPAIENRLNALRAQLGELTLTASENHPQVQALRNQIATAEAQLREQASSPSPDDMSRLRASPEVNLIPERSRLLTERQTYLQSQRAEVEARLTALQTAVARTPTVGAAVREADSRREAVQRTLDRVSDQLNAARVQMRLEADSRSAQVVVAVPAGIPDEPAGLSRNKLSVVMIVMAGVLAAGVVFTIDLMDRSVREVHQMRALGDLPVVLVPRYAADGTVVQPRLVTPFLALVFTTVAVAVFLLYQKLVELWGILQNYL